MSDGPRKRKNFRIPVALSEWAENYAKSKNKSLTQLLIDCLTELRTKEEGGQP